MSNKQKLSLRVGGVYLNGQGKKVRIAMKDRSEYTIYPFACDNGYWYTSDGLFASVSNSEERLHLVSVMSEPADNTLTQADLQRLSELVRGVVEYEHLWMSGNKTLVAYYWQQAVKGAEDGQGKFVTLNHYKKMVQTSRKRIKSLSETQKRLKATLRKGA